MPKQRNSRIFTVIGDSNFPFNKRIGREHEKMSIKDSQTAKKLIVKTFPEKK